MDAVPLGFVQFHDAAHLGDADVVVEDVDPAEFFDDAGDGPADCGGVGDIEGEVPCAAAFVQDQPLGLLGGRLVDVRAHHRGAFTGKGDGGGLSVAHAGRAGSGTHNEGDFSF